MNAMELKRPGAGTLEACTREVPIALPGDVLVKVRACGVCRTDLDIVDGELANPDIPVIPGHEIIGVVERLGDGVDTMAVGDRVGILWLGYACDVCDYCTRGLENLCASARFTGYQIDGGYAEYVVADARFVFKIPDRFGDIEAAPLMCGGVIGYRAYRMAGEGRRIGLYGFGMASQIIAQIAIHEGREVFAFTSPGKTATQELARSLGATWAGASTDAPPEPLDAAIIFAPVGDLVPEALSRVVPAGTVVCAGAHMSDVPAFQFRLLSEERVVRSVASLTRKDARDFLTLAPKVPVRTSVERYDLADANRALDDVRQGKIRGAAVLVPSA